MSLKSTFLLFVGQNGRMGAVKGEHTTSKAWTESVDLEQCVAGMYVFISVL